MNAPHAGHRLAHCFRPSPYRETGYDLQPAGPPPADARRALRRISRA